MFIDARINPLPSRLPCVRCGDKLTPRELANHARFPERFCPAVGDETGNDAYVRMVIASEERDDDRDVAEALHGPLAPEVTVLMGGHLVLGNNGLPLSRPGQTFVSVPLDEI